MTVRAGTIPVLAVFAILGCAGSEGAGVASEAATPDAAAMRVEILMTPYFGDLRTIPLQVGDWAGRVLLDTGGGLSLITPSVADSIGCEPVGRLTGFRYTGEPIHGPTCGVRRVGSGTWSRETELGVFDLMSLLGDAPPVDGLVGLSLFEGSIVTIDLGHDRLVIEGPGWKPQPGALELHVRASRQAGGAALDVFVAVNTPRGPIWLELDSGNTGPVILAPHAAQMLGIAAQPSETPADVTLDVVGLGPVPSSAVIREAIYDGLLNSGFFLGRVVTLDLASVRAWVSPAG